MTCTERSVISSILDYARNIRRILDPVMEGRLNLHTDLSSCRNMSLVMLEIKYISLSVRRFLLHDDDDVWEYSHLRQVLATHEHWLMRWYERAVVHNMLHIYPMWRSFNCLSIEHWIQGFMSHVTDRVARAGFEPVSSCAQGKHANHGSHYNLLHWCVYVSMNE